MKKILPALMAACLMLFGSSACALDERYYGEWLPYAFCMGEDVTDTVADYYWRNDETDGAYLILDDGSMAVRSGDEYLYAGAWTEIDGGENDINSSGSHPVIIRLSLLNGEEKELVFMGDLMYSGMISANKKMQMFSVYYKPEILSLQPEALKGRAWEMKDVFVESVSDGEVRRNKMDSQIKKINVCFSLNEDMTADLVLNYLPKKGTWSASGFNICIEAENGATLVLEPQFDSSLFGVYQEGPDAQAHHVVFEPIDDFDFQEPVAVEKLCGHWELCDVHAPNGIHTPVEQLDFTIELEIDERYAVYNQFYDNGDVKSIKLYASTVGGPVLEENQTGTVFLMTDNSGNGLYYWLLKDGRLYLRSNDGYGFLYEKR